MVRRTRLDRLPSRGQTSSLIVTFLVVVSVLPAGSLVALVGATPTGDDVGFTDLAVTTQKGQSNSIRLISTNWSFQPNASVDELVIRFEDSTNGTVPTTDTNPKTVVGPADPGNATVKFRVNDKNKIQRVRVTQILSDGSVYECVGPYDSNGMVVGDFSCATTETGEAQRLTTSSGTTEYTQGGGSVVVDDTLVVNGSSYDSFQGGRVSIDGGFDPGADILSYDGSVIPTDSDGNPIITGTYNQTTGVLNFTGTATVEVYQDLLRTVAYDNTRSPPTTADRNVTFTLTAASQEAIEVYYNPATGHYYRYVENQGVSWTAANASAANSTYAGMDGYLATVTSRQENDFLLDRFQAAGWLGASDSAAEGEWRWVTGPEGEEGGGSGRYFFEQTAAHVAWTDPYPAPPAGVPGGGHAVNGSYSNWNPRHEPDNKFPFFGGQDYAYLCHGPGRCPEGMWTDAATNSPPFTPRGYFVEYGGPNVQPETQFTNVSDSKTITITTTSSDVTAPTANATVDKTTVSPGETITLDGSGSDGTGSAIVRYEWDTTGNGRTDLTGATNTTSFQNASNYTISLTVTDEGGNTDTDAVTVTVEDTNPPTAVLSVDGPTTVERGASVQFTGTNSTDDIAVESFEWDFGDASPNTTEVSPTHGFDGTGTYTVTLLVTDTSGNTDTDTVTIDVTSSPRPTIRDFNATNPAGSNLTVSITADQRLDQLTVGVYDTDELSPRADDSAALEFTIDETDFGSSIANGNYTYTNTTLDLAAGNYTLRLEQAENASTGDSGTGQETTVTIQGETVPPSFADGYPTVRNATTSGFEVVVNASEDGTAYFVVVEDGATTPSASQVENGQNASGQNALASGSGNLTADTEIGLAASGLSENTAYDVYVVAKDGAGNVNVSSAVDAATLDGTAPTVTIDSPTATTYGTDSVPLNVSADETISTWKYAIDDGANQTFAPNTTVAGLADGQHTITIYATDAGGNTASKTVTFTVDTTAPTVTIDSPTATTYGTDSVTLNVSANETISTWEYSLDDGANQTFAPNTTLSGLGEGQHTVTVYATDEGGNVDSSTVTFSVDTIAPTVTIDSPTATTYGSDAVSLNVSADESISTWEYSLDDGANQTFAPNATLSGLSEGQHTITIYATDAGGNVVSKTVTFTVDTIAPTVTIDSPTSGTYGTDSVALNVSANETISTWEYALDDGANQSFAPNTTISGLTDGQHTLTVYATDEGGNVANETVTFTVDTTPPSIVAGSFAVSNPSGQDVVVTFNSTEQLATIDVGISGAESANLTRSDFTETPTGDGNYTYTATYAASTDGTYTATLVVAADSTGNDGAAGESDSVTVDTTGPPAPGNVTATTLAGGNVTVSFDDVDDGATTYSVRRTTTSGSGYTEVGTVADDDSGNYTFTDTTASDGTTYYYVVVAIDGSGNEGSPSSEATATTDGTAPTITNFAVANPSGTLLNVSFASDESLANVTVAVSGAETATLSSGDFTESQDGGTYTYNATYVGSSDGSYTATLLAAEDAAGNDGSNGESATVTVDTTAPTADAGSNRTADEDTVVTFDGSNSTDNVGVDGYEWDFGDGSANVTGPTPTHTFADPGTYTVTLAVTDASGNRAIDTLVVTVNDTTAPAAPSVPDLAAGSDTGSSNTDNVTSDATPTLTGTAESNATVTLVSDLDGTLGTTTADGDGNWSFTPGSALSDGTHNLSATATDEAGNTGSASTALAVVVDTTVPTADAGSNQSVDEDTAVNFDGSGSADNDEIATWEWDFGDGNTATGQAPAHTYPEPGTYTVTLNVTDAAGNVDQDTLVVSATDTTSPTADAGSNQSVDEDTAVSFDGSNSTDNVAIDAYEWDFDDGTNATGSAPSHTYTDPGTYTVTLNVTDAAGNEDRDTLVVTVNDTTAPTISNFTVSNPSGQQVRVSFNASESIATATVAIGGTETATLTAANFSETTASGTYTYEATYQGSADGEYTATLTTAADAAGNDGAGSESGSVEVGNLTVVARAEASSYVVAVGSSLELRANESTVPDGATTTYEWDVGDDGSVEHTGEAVSHTFSAPGTTNVSLTVTANGIEDADTISIDVRDEAAPTANLSVASSVDVGQSLSFDASNSTDNVAIDTYEWDFGDGTTASGGSLTGPSHTYTEPGSYTVTLTARDAADNSDTATATVLVRGPEANATASAVAFGEVAVNSTASASVGVTNDGTVALNLTGASITGSNASAFDLSTASNQTVRPGETRSILVAFSPTSAGSHDATLALSTNDTASPTLSVALNGTGVESDLRVNRTNVSFGEVTVGSSGQATVTIENTGGASVEMTAVEVVGSDAEQFDVDGSLSAIPAGGTRDVTVVFEPTATGHHSANLRVEADDGSTVSVSLDGVGVGPDIQLASETISFVPVGKGDTAVVTARVSNYGTRPLAIENVTLAGTDADQFDVANVPQTIAVGETKSFDVRFEPDSVGTFEGSIEIASNDSDEPTVSVAVDGEAVGANIGIDKRTVNFGNVTQGQTVYMNLTVSNRATSKADLTINRTALVGKDPENFEINRGGAPFTLAPGESHDIEIAFTPLASGTKQAQLQIFSDAANEPQLDVWLSNTRTYIIVQQTDASTTENLTVAVNGHNVISNDDLAINVSRPDTATYNVGFDELNMTFKPGGNFDIEVVHADRPVGSDGQTYDEADTDVLQYVRLNHTTADPATDYDNTSIRYRVKKSALPSGVGADDATLYRWNTTQNQWNEMESRLVSESDTHYVFLVETPGFSQFAIAAPTASSSGGGSHVSPGSPRFALVSTAISNADLLVGESATIEAVVTNNGDASGSFTATLEIDGTAITSQQLSLAPGETRTVTFAETFADPGTYQVTISGTHVSAVTVTRANSDETEEPDQPDETTPADSDSVDDAPDQADDGPQEADNEVLDSDTVDDHDDCELFGFDFGRFVVCWYWWVLLVVLVLLAGYWLRERFRDEDDDRW